MTAQNDPELSGQALADAVAELCPAGLDGYAWRDAVQSWAGYGNGNEWFTPDMLAGFMADDIANNIGTMSALYRDALIKRRADSRGTE